MDMAHGYLGDGYGSHGEIDPHRDDDRERGWRGRDEDRRGRGRGRGMMFTDRDQGSSSGDRSEGGRSYSAHPDDHYRSWRDRHMSELDRDYQDYCREREQQFHRDFDDWRRQRSGNPEPLQTGMTQTGLSADPSGITEAETETEPPTNEGSDPMAAATLGTTSSRRRRTL
jgi:hypothetical protein